MSVESDVTDDQADVLREPVRKRRRLIPQFRLRTLFVAAVLMSLLLGWYGRHVYRVRQERAAAEELRRVGAQLSTATFEYGGMTLPADLYGLLPWFYVEEHTFVALDSAKGASDEDTRYLGGLRGVRSLMLKGDGFTDEALRSLGPVPSLDLLYLQETRITGEGLADLAARDQVTQLRCFSGSPTEPSRILDRIDALPNLSILLVSQEPLTVEGMRATASLQNLFSFNAQRVTSAEPGAFAELARAPRLRELQVESFPVAPFGDEELSALCEIESLESLALPGHQVTDAGFARLADLPKLRALFIRCPKVTDEGAKTLAEIATLEQVALNYAVTDAALVPLRDLPNLAQVFLPISVSREGAQRFANDRPECEVWHSDPGSSTRRLEPQLKED
ncbi:MAG TPA: hypothetical protein VGN57_04685 [Pirellulaceae bacterium]|jgi:hypothetical protein|nr:hypothetical protein [Pirellulaceae bacterium]